VVDFFKYSSAYIVFMSYVCRERTSQGVDKLVPVKKTHETWSGNVTWLHSRWKML